MPLSIVCLPRSKRILSQPNHLWIKYWWHFIQYGIRERRCCLVLVNFDAIYKNGHSSNALYAMVGILLSQINTKMSKGVKVYLNIVISFWNFLLTFQLHEITVYKKQIAYHKNTYRWVYLHVVALHLAYVIRFPAVFLFHSRSWYVPGAPKYLQEWILIEL